MQRKTIEKTISTKLESWLESIKDAELRKKVKENILVSGGSIVSLFLNEKVNDYDIYLKDMDVVKAITKYYIGTVNEKGNIEVLDGREREGYIQGKPSISEGYTNEYGKKVKDDSIYAVSVRTLKPDQIKIYLPYGGMAFNKELKDEELNYAVKFLSPNAISLSGDIQIVIRFHGNNEAIHKTYDFIHATNYFTFEDGLVTNIAALESILSKTLRYQGSLYPVTSVIRMKKFIKRGWNISAGEILKICFQISKLELSDPDVLEEQLIGVDIAYFGKLIEILRNVKQDKEIDSHYLNTIIDKVFNDVDSE